MTLSGLKSQNSSPGRCRYPSAGRISRHVGDRLRDRQRVGVPPFAAAALVEDRLQARAADVLHDDVAGAVVLDEVEDLDDVRVLDLGEEAALGERGRHRVVVAGVQQSLEHDPALFTLRSLAR